MAPPLRPRRADGTCPAALRALAVALGLFLIFNGLDKLAWFADSTILAARLQAWTANATAPTRWYIETVAVPGIPLFARVVPIAELSTGVALILGFRVRVAALIALVMVSNFHVARGLFFSREFLTDGVGLPVMGALVALIIAGARLPWSVTK